MYAFPKQVAHGVVFGLGVCTMMALPPIAYARSPGAATSKAPQAPAVGKEATMSGAPSEEMRRSMMQGMKSMESIPMSGDTDREFAEMMKIHHQGAIDMARIELKDGKDAKLRAMAKQIIAAQQKEIKEFDQWLAARKGKK